MNHKSRSKSLHYLMATVLVYYVDDAEKPYQRHINIVLEKFKPNLLAADLEKLQENAAVRATQLFGITPEQIRDMAILNIFPLANVSPDVFHGTKDKTAAVVLDREGMH